MTGRQVAEVQLGGGENVAAPATQIPPGEALLLQNYELSFLGGYRRVDGFERADGRPSPSAAVYKVLNFITGSTSISVDDTLTGASSGDSGRVLQVNLTSGSWVGGDAAGNIVLGNPTGVFQDAEDLQVSGSTVAVASGITEIAATDALDTSYSELAIETYRADIQAVPGSGPIRGVWVYNGKRYAFRDDAAGTTCKMYEESSSGWVEVTTPSLSPGGAYEFDNFNFSGSAGSQKMYGCDGVNKGFMFDGTTFTQITTGMTVDTPIKVIAHKYQLFFLFPGGSLQFSSVGDPTTWSPVTGAGELALGEEGSGLMILAGDVLGIWTRNKTFVLYGSSSADWDLKVLNPNLGAIDKSVQQISTNPFALGDQGIVSQSPTYAYGNFVQNIVSDKIHPLLEEYKDYLISSLSVRSKKQYRLFFVNGADYLGISCLVQGGKFVGSSRMDYGMPIRCCCSGRATDGSEMLLFGSDDGYVYDMDKGTSFDGAAVEAYIRFPFANLKSPENNKRFFKVIMLMDSPSQITMQFTPDFSYGDTSYLSPLTQDIIGVSGGGIWGVDFWGSFLWSEAVVGSATAYIDGSGNNMSMLIYTSDIYAQPHTLQTMMLHYEVRGLKR